MPQGLPPGTPPPSQNPTSNPPSAGPNGAGGSAPGPEQFLLMIEKGFEGLAPIMKSAGKSLPPEDLQLFAQAQKMSEALIQTLTQADDGGGKSPSPAAGKAPIPMNASPSGSTPSNYGGG